MTLGSPPLPPGVLFWPDSQLRQEDLNTPRRVHRSVTSIWCVGEFVPFFQPRVSFLTFGWSKAFPQSEVVSDACTQVQQAVGHVWGRSGARPGWDKSCPCCHVTGVVHDAVSNGPVPAPVLLHSHYGTTIDCWESRNLFQIWWLHQEFCGPMQSWYHIL